jgi:hypothetical protein
MVPASEMTPLSIPSEYENKRCRLIIEVCEDQRDGHFEPLVELAHATQSK